MVYDANKNPFLSFLVPSQAPTDVQLFNTSTTSLKAFWGPVPECCRHGIIHGYHLTLKTNATSEFAQNESVSGGQYELEFSGLLKGYSYRVSISGFTNAGKGPSSEEVVAMTEEDGKGT